MSEVEVLSRYEVRINACRGRAKTDLELHGETWRRICTILEERAGLSSTHAQDRKQMRLAAREIRAALQQREDLIGVTNEQKLMLAERQCYYVMREVAEELTRDYDCLVKHVAAGHPLKRRMSAAARGLIRMVRVLGMHLKEMEARCGSGPVDVNNDMK